MHSLTLSLDWPVAAPSMKRSRAAASWILAVILIAACNREAVKPAAPETPVFLISIDTLRSDHLSAYGYKNAAQPSIDKFRRDAILFESAFSQCPQTLV